MDGGVPLHIGVLQRRLRCDGRYQRTVFVTNGLCCKSHYQYCYNASAHIQMSEIEWKNRKAERSGEENFTPTYTIEDALGAIKLFRGVKYNERITVSAGVDIRFTDIGHLLGSAAIEIWLREGDTYPDLSLSLHIASNSDTCSFDLSSGQPFRLHRFDSKRSERKLVTSLGDTLHAAFLLSAEFSFFRL